MFFEIILWQVRRRRRSSLKNDVVSEHVGGVQYPFTVNEKVLIKVNKILSWSVLSKGLESSTLKKSYPKKSLSHGCREIRERRKNW